jgi:hypothetical protein
VTASYESSEERVERLITGVIKGVPLMMMLFFIVMVHAGDDSSEKEGDGFEENDSFEKEVTASKERQLRRRRWHLHSPIPPQHPDPTHTPIRVIRAILINP